MTAIAEQQAAQNASMTEALEGAEGQIRKVRVVGGDVYEGKIKQAGDKDGERRFQVGRRIVSVSTVVAVIEDVPANGAGPAEAQANAAGAEAKAAGGTQKQADKAADAVRREAAPTVTLTSGAVATGKTVTIRCAWVDPAVRTKKQQELFDTGFEGVEKGKGYEAMLKAAGNGKGAEAAKPDGSERVIKVQDAFQVRFSPENQKKHRNELRRRKATARRAEREAAQAATS